MIHPFLVVLGASLSVLGLAGMALGSSTTDTISLRSLTHNALYLITGILALMSTFERRWVARRICVVIGALHAAIFISGFTTHEFRSADLCVSAIVAVSCFAAGRPRRRYAMELGRAGALSTVSRREDLGGV